MEQNQTMPLAGVKVLELATVVATPVVGRLLATYGAEVVKIENFPAGDNVRNMSPGHAFPNEPYKNPLFDFCNTGKKLVGVNLKSESGKEIFHKLLGEADIFITNVRMKSLVKMGIDYNSLKEKYPRLIYGYFSGFGTVGPQVELPGFDTTAFWMRSGASSGWTLPGSFPLRPSFGCGDIASGSLMLNGILMALYGRNTTGKGTMVDTSLLGSGIFCNATGIMNAQEPYGKKYPVDRFHPWDPFSDYYQCKDGKWLAIIEKNYPVDRFTFAKVFDIPELAEDPECENLGILSRSGKIVTVIEKVQAKMLTKNRDEWIEILSAVDIPNEYQTNFADVSKDEQAWANGYFEELAYSEDVKTAMPMPPFNLSNYTRRSYVAEGGVGADTDEVLTGMGYSAEEIKALREGKVIQ